MDQQAEFQFAEPSDLARFRIPHHGRDVTYGDVSRHLRHLWRHGDRGQAAELALVAGEIFNEPYWAQRYPSARCTCPSGDGSLRWPCPSHPPK